MGGHGGPSGYKSTFKVSVPDTPLTGSEKQVEWAKDIREGIARAIQAYYDAAIIDYTEKAKAGGKKGAVYQKKLSDVRPTATEMAVALAKVESAGWFIDHKLLPIDFTPTMEQLIENKYNSRSAIIQNGMTLRAELKKAGYLG